MASRHRRATLSLEPTVKRYPACLKPDRKNDWSLRSSRLFVAAHTSQRFWSRLRLAGIALMLAGATETRANAADFGGLKIGMIIDEAIRVISTTGTAKRMPLQSSDERLSSELVYNDSYNATICRGRVIAINHTLEPTFRAWAREVRVATAERGPGTYHVDSREGVNHVSHVRVTWPIAPEETYDIGYYELQDQVLTTESLARKCT